MIVVTGDGKIKKNLTKDEVIKELKAAQAKGDRFASVTGAYAEGYNPFQIEKEAGYTGASKAATLRSLDESAGKMDKSVSYVLRDIPASIWAEYQNIAKRNGTSTAEELRKHIINTVMSYGA